MSKKESGCMPLPDNLSGQDEIISLHRQLHKRRRTPWTTYCVPRLNRRDQSVLARSRNPAGRYRGKMQRAEDKEEVCEPPVIVARHWDLGSHEYPAPSSRGGCSDSGFIFLNQNGFSFKGGLFRRLGIGRPRLQLVPHSNGKWRLCCWGEQKQISLSDAFRYSKACGNCSARMIAARRTSGYAPFAPSHGGGKVMVPVISGSIP